MRFRDDTRGVTVQVGAVLLFATLIIALSVYQATVVPSENADVEYRHSQQVQGQLVDVRNALVATAETGDARPATVSLGTEYPNRVFLVNPPPAAGTLETERYGDPSIEVSNVNATNPETREYLDGSWSAETKSLSYVPGYNEYRDAPELRYEASLLSNYYPEQNTSVPLTDQLLVDIETRTVSLVALNGSLGTSRSSSVAVEPKALSAPAERVQVQPQNPGQPVNVTVPTVVDASVLRNSTSLGDNPNVTVVQNGTERVTLSIDWSGPFTLRTAKVGVGSDATDAPPHYLTLVESDDDSVTVEARDAFNNPEPGQLVQANRSDLFEGDDERTTKEDGRATFDVADGQTGDVQFELVGGAGDAAERTVNASVDTTDSGTGDGGGGSGSEAYVVDWLEERSDGQNAGLSCDGENCTLDASVQSSVTLSADSTPRVDGGTFTFEVENQSVGEVSPPEGTTDDAGEGTTTFNANANGTTYAYVSGGGSGDRIELTVENYGSGVSATPQVSARVDDLTRNRGNSGVFIGSYSLSNTNSSFERVDIHFEDESNPSQSSTLSSTATRAGRRYTGGQSGHQFEIRYEVIYTDDNGDEYVAASTAISDVADARNPSGNADLGTSDTASLTSWEFVDQSDTQQNDVRYQFSYDITASGSFSELRAFSLNVNSNGATTVMTRDSRSQNNQNLQPGDGAGTQYHVGLVVRDANGAVVDDVRIEDDADGTGTYSGP